MEVGVGQRGVGVVHATVVLHELCVLIFDRVLFCALEQHVLEEMSGSKKGFRIKRATDFHVNSSS